MSKLTELWEQILFIIKTHPRLCTSALLHQNGKIVAYESDVMCIAVESDWLEQVRVDLPAITSVCKQILSKAIDVRLVTWIKTSSTADFNEDSDESGIVYLAYDGRIHKIGFTARTTKARLHEIKGNNPYAEIVNEVYSLNGKILEKLFHDYYKDYNISREWFDFPESIEIEKQFVSIANKLSKQVDIISAQATSKKSPKKKTNPTKKEQTDVNCDKVSLLELEQLNTIKTVLSEFYSSVFPECKFFIKDSEIQPLLDLMESKKHKILHNLRGLFLYDIGRYCLLVEFVDLTELNHNLIANRLKLLADLSDDDLFNLLLYIIRLFIGHKSNPYRQTVINAIVEHYEASFPTLFDDIFLKHIIGVSWYQQTHLDFYANKRSKGSKNRWENMLLRYMRAIMSYNSNPLICNGCFIIPGYTRFSRPPVNFTGNPARYPNKLLAVLEKVNKNLVNEIHIVIDYVSYNKGALLVCQEYRDGLVDYKNFDVSGITKLEEYFTELLADYLP
jgi:hypothetical protein